MLERQIRWHQGTGIHPVEMKGRGVGLRVPHSHRQVFLARFRLSRQDCRPLHFLNPKPQIPDACFLPY